MTDNARGPTGVPTATLREVLPSWKVGIFAKANTISRAELALRLLEQAVGIVPLFDFAKATGAKFVRFLPDEEGRGLGRKAAENHLYLSHH